MPILITISMMVRTTACYGCVAFRKVYAFKPVQNNVNKIYQEHYRRSEQVMDRIYTNTCTGQYMLFRILADEVAWSQG
jgi:hypothetical protein